MSIENCLNNAVAGGELSKADAERLARQFHAFRETYANGGPANADAQAKADLHESLAAEAKAKRRRAKLALKNAREVDADLKSYRTPGGRADIAAAALLKLEHFGEAAFSSVEGRRKAIVGMAHARMEELLHNFRRSAVLGDKKRWNAADLDNVRREVFGIDTGDAQARAFANAWMTTAEWLRKRFNAAGGDIGKLENWGLPQHHDARALRKAKLQPWKDFIAPRLDVARMKHPLTGRPIAPRELDAILDEIWLSIATDGWSKRQPTRQPFGRGALARQRAEHRFLVFKDPDTWLEYQQAFGGGGDIFAVMMGHINGMAKDIAAMEVLGPNPAGTVEMLKQMIVKEATAIAAGQPGRLGDVKPERAMDKARRAGARIDAVWGSISGSLETPVDSMWANGFAAARSLVTASVLGAAAISSLSDAGTSMIARQFAGLPARHAFREILKGFTTASRREAVQAGLILDSAMNVFHQQARYVGTLSGPEWASWLADRVLTWSGLSPWTQAARHAFGLAFQVELANQAGKRLEELPPALAETLRRHGFDGRKWDLVRKAPLHAGNAETRMLRPAEIAERIDERLAERYLEMIQAETEYAVPNGSHRSRTVLLDQNRPGTLTGEIVRSFAQFKSFGAVFAILHGGRVAAELAADKAAGRNRIVGNGAKYAGALLLSTTLFGAISLQLKSLVAGRDPRDATDPLFWGAALLQGGGLGIYGDFMFSNINRYGGGLGATIGGPMAQRIGDFWNLTAGNVAQLASGEKTNFGRELVKFARGNIPGGNIWYLRLAFEREVLDQVQYLADPEANAAFKRQQQFFQREFSQGYWWRPGERLPARAPDLGAAFGQPSR